MATILLLLSAVLFQDYGYREGARRANIPSLLHRVFREQQLEADYDFSFRINPCYLRGDFNGDGRLDLAVLIRQRSSDKGGIAIVHGGSDRVFVLAAGNAMRGNWDDMRSLDVWGVYRRGTVSGGVGGGEPPVLKGEAILMGKSEASSLLVFWTGTAYDWYSQGD